MTGISHNQRLGVLTLAGIVLTALCVQFLQPAVSQEPKQPAMMRLEYTTAEVATDSLRNKLNELGDEGWEVFSIVRLDLVLAQQSDGQSHLRAEKLLVSARRDRQ